MFIDESGDHNLEKIDMSYPVFVLAGCIFEKEYYEKSVIPNFNQLKQDFFGGNDIVFHTAEMIRPAKSKEKRFIKLIDEKFRKSFYGSLNALLEKTCFSIVACVIKKQKHMEKYGVFALDPYLLSFDNLLNRFIFQIKFPEQGIIMAEKRNSILDNQLEIAWLNAKISGTRLVKSAEIKEKIDNFKIIAKSKNETGLQIADLIASPIGRHVVNMKRKHGNEINFEIINHKFIKDRLGRVENCGISIVPK
jgi:hypothetical protein